MNDRKRITISGNVCGTAVEARLVELWFLTACREARFIVTGSEGLCRTVSIFHFCNSSSSVFRLEALQFSSPIRSSISKDTRAF